MGAREHTRERLGGGDARAAVADADAADVSGASSADATVSGATRAKSLNSRAHATMKCEEPSCEDPA